MSLGNAGQRLTPVPLQISHHMKQGALLYPRHRVLQLQSPNPYEPMNVGYGFTLDAYLAPQPSTLVFSGVTDLFSF